MSGCEQFSEDPREGHPNFVFRPRVLYRTMCHPDFLAHFVVPGLAGMRGLVSSWRPWAYAAWTF